MQLAFARAKIALDAAIIEVVPPLPGHNARRDNLAFEWTHRIARSRNITITGADLFRLKKKDPKCREGVARQQLLSENSAAISSSFFRSPGTAGI
jgi:hypothetical protein